jgi:N-glycosidase YbiA
MPRESRSGASRAADVDESVSVDNGEGESVDTDEEADAGKGAIYFYSTQDIYGYLSNFSRHPIVIGGHTWPTVEHYFQAQKFAGTEHVGAILRAASPTVAARMGRSRQRPLRSDWEEVKDEIMHEALFAKFSQHPELRGQLLETGDARIVEHTARDRYWADGGDGSGRNMLGRLLMRVRDELR